MLSSEGEHGWAPRMCRPDGIGRNQEAGHGEAEYDGENAVEMARILFGRCKGPLNSTIVADSKNDLRIDAEGDKFREWLLWGGSVCSGAVDLRWDGVIRRYHLIITVGFLGSLSN